MGTYAKIVGWVDNRRRCLAMDFIMWAYQICPNDFRLDFSEWIREVAKLDIRMWNEGYYKRKNQGSSF